MTQFGLHPTKRASFDTWYDLRADLGMARPSHQATLAEVMSDFASIGNSKA
jgi:hypothetical protein